MPIPVCVHRVILYCYASVSLLGNGLLLLLLFSRSGIALGNYRFLLMAFACLDIFLSLFHAWYIPMFTLGRYGFVYYGYGCLFGTGFIARNSNVIYSATFIMPLMLISLHFVYRYLSLARPRFVKEHFRRFSVFCVIYSIMFTTSIGFMANAMCNMGVPKRFHGVLSEYGIRRWMPGMNLGAIEYMNAYSEKNVQAIVIILIGGAIGGLSIAISFYCMHKIVEAINNRALEIRARRMHIQLFRALLLQFAVPCLFSFVPYSAIVVLPITGIPLGQAGNVLGLFASLFPALDPILIILSISRFRTTLLEWKDVFTGRKAMRNEQQAVKERKSHVSFVRPKGTQTV